MDYKSAGVDILAEDLAISALSKWIKKTFQNRKGVIAEFGHYANILDIGGGKGIVMSTDGVGSKILIAEMLGKFDTVAIDMIAMNVNDIICMGAEPLALVDYIAVRKADPEVFDQIGKGLAEGCRQSGIVCLGGETASLPEIIAGSEKSFDLAGTAVGLVDTRKVITGEKVRAGDKIVGLPSNGLHSNGYTLARKVLLPLGMESKLKNGRTLGEEMLVPTRIYVKEVLSVIDKYFDHVHGLAHITGGGFRKITRLSKDLLFEINLGEIPEIFKLIQSRKVEWKEMYRTFNCGMGFCIVCDKEKAEDIAKSCKGKIIGEVKRGKGVTVNGIKIE